MEGRAPPRAGAELADSVPSFAAQNAKARTAGCVIDTFGWVDGAAPDVLLDVIRALAVDVVLVIDDERLFHALSSQVAEAGAAAGSCSTQVVALAKSPGAVPRSKAFRLVEQSRHIRRYFYGLPHLDFSVHSVDVSLEAVGVYKIGAPAVPQSCLPIGTEAIVDPGTRLVRIVPSVELLHRLLSVSSYVPPPDADVHALETHSAAVGEANVLGFVCVLAVDMERGTMTVMAPAPAPLPGRVLLMGTVTFFVFPI